MALDPKLGGTASVHILAVASDRYHSRLREGRISAQAARALEEVRDGMQLGLGTGSTAKHFVELLGERVRAGLKVIGVPTSETTRADAEFWAGRLEANTSMPTYLEITNEGADKRRALQFLCERLGIPHEKTVAVGDGRNDSSMISWAARGYAVEGAAPEVVAAAGGRTIGRPGTGGIADLVSELLEAN